MLVRAFATLALVAALVGCEDDTLNRLPDPPPPPPDAGVTPPPPDAGVVVPDAGVEPAREEIYINTGDTLFSYDPQNNEATRIGAFTSDSGPITDMTDIAIDLEGRMFGGTTSKEVWQIDPTTARVSKRFSFEDHLNGLTFLSDGTLVVAGERVSLVDPVTGRVEREIVGAERYQTSGDIVGLPDGLLYWTVRGGRDEPGDVLVRITPRTGFMEEMGRATVGRLYGLGYANGTLFGFSSEGVVVRLNAETGAIVRQDTLTARWWGATTNPVRWP